MLGTVTNTEVSENVLEHIFNYLFYRLLFCQLIYNLCHDTLLAWVGWIVGVGSDSMEDQCDAYRQDHIYIQELTGRVCKLTSNNQSKKAVVRDYWGVCFYRCYSNCCDIPNTFWIVAITNCTATPTLS